MKLSEKPINARSSWMIDNDGREQEGMTLFEYYMGKALEGLCANPELVDKGFDWIASTAFDHAKAAIAKLEKESK